jgi:predicted lipase
MYTYGAPRVGNKAFADAFNERLKGDAWRITNKADIVPRYVVGWLFVFGYVSWYVYVCTLQ